MPDADGMLLRVYQLLAAIAGGLSALSFVKWREFDWLQRTMIVAVAGSFSIFTAPWVQEIAPTWLGLGTPNGLHFLLYMTATGSNTLIASIIRRYNSLIGDSAEEVVK